MTKQMMTMKELPVTEQPYEKCERYGASSLSDAELIAVIIRSGTANLRSTETAALLLSKTANNEGIAALAKMSQKDLIQVPGIGRVKAIQLICCVELATRLQKAVTRCRIVLSDPKTVADYYMQELRNLSCEQAKVLFFDTKSRLLGDQVISKGSVNASILSPREIFLAALEAKAVHIILLHNHPSGDPTPSKEDILVTKRIYDAGNCIGIELMDHIIIGDNRYISMREKRLF